MDSSDINNGAAADAGKHFLTIVSPFFLAVALKLNCDGVLRGAGRVKSFMATTFSDLILRVVLHLYSVHSTVRQEYGYPGLLDGCCLQYSQTFYI